MDKSLLNNSTSEENENDLQSLFNTVTDFLWVLDVSGTIIHMNKTVVKRLGYTREELLGKSVLMVLPEEKRSEAAEIVKQMLEGKAAFCPIPIVSKNGKRIPVETRVIHGRWNGSPAIFGVSKDVSDLKLSEEKFSKAFHMTKIIAGISEHATGKFVDINEEFCSALGFMREEVIGRTSHELNILSENVRSEIFAKYDIKKGIHNVDTEIRAKDGRILKVVLSAELIYIQDQQYLYSTVIDITPLFVAQEMLREKEEKLKEMNRTKDKFMSLIAHDLKSPFNVILGFSEILKDSITEGNLEKAEKYANTIRDASEQALGFLFNLLEWTRTQMDGISFSPEILGVENQVLEILRLTNYQAISKNLTVEYDIEPGLLVDADRNMLRTILINLISNAIKFSMPGSKIQIKAVLANRYVEFMVRDRGVGIRPEHFDCLFRIDAQFTTNGTQKEKGSGLGLLLCKDFVEKHEGRIWATSEYGKGSAFYFTIPGNRMPEIN